MVAKSGESYTETAIRMDDRLKTIMDNLKTVLAGNSGISREFLDKMNDLTLHIDYQDGLLKARIKNLEMSIAELKS